MKSIFDEEFCSNEYINKVKEENSEEKKEYENILNQYKDLNSEQLQDELYKKANELKQNGNLTNEQLEGLNSTLAPFLNDEQKKLLENLVNRLK